MNAALLPAWVQVLLLVLQALAVPVIAAAGVWIARQQMHIARVKLQHDLYDRRYAVFQALSWIASSPGLPESTLMSLETCSERVSRSHPAGTAATPGLSACRTR